MKILIAGDFCPSFRVSELINQAKFNDVLDEVKSTIEAQKIDYSIVNLEAPITLSNYSPIDKVGPNLKCSINTIDAIKYAGFNCVTLANNHILDYGEGGVKDTIDSCVNNSIDFVGVGENLARARRILYKHIDNKKLAIINCCENEYSIATDGGWGANPLVPIQQYYDIQEAKSKADYVLVIVHGGHEGYQLPSVRMVDTYRFFIDAGADAVINHHQHCFSGYEVYNNKPIFYGIGNFCFDWKGEENKKWNLGYMVVLDFAEDIKIDYIPYNQCSEIPKIKIIEKSIIEQEVSQLNSVIVDRNLLTNANFQYFTETSKLVESRLEPITNEFYKKLRYKNLVPSFISIKFLKLLYNLVECESHRDRLLHFLQKKLVK